MTYSTADWEKNAMMGRCMACRHTWLCHKDMACHCGRFAVAICVRFVQSPQAMERELAAARATHPASDDVSIATTPEITPRRSIMAWVRSLFSK